MIRLSQILPHVLATLLVLACSRPSFGRSEEQTMLAAHEVLQQFQELYIRQIPESLLAEAHAVAIIPDVIKLGFVVGGQRGHGVVVIRQPGGSWRAPVFITITGGSVGWQIGAQATDFMLVFKSPKSVEGLLRGTFTLGADAAVAAGPVGRRLGAATDSELKAEIYSYSRSRGLFAGVSLEGSALQIDDHANAAYYGVPPPGAVPPPVPASALKLSGMIASLTSPTVAASAQAAAQSAFLTPVPGIGEPQRHVEATRAELARASTNLNPLLDVAWRRHLALPVEVFQPGQQVPLSALEGSLQRYNEVARNQQFQVLTGRPEFQATHRQLQLLFEQLRPAANPQLALPPPPGGPR